MANRSLTDQPKTSLPASARLLSAFSAVILGAFLVYVAGFSHIDALHNGAHDTRHAFALPCH